MNYNEVYMVRERSSKSLDSPVTNSYFVMKRLWQLYSTGGGRVKFVMSYWNTNFTYKVTE